jgi:uncharacterized protein involved in exopolysaccharide biosynthesis
VGATPHLSDYWQVISRRFWLVLTVFAVTTASAIWTVSQQETFYQGSMSLQVSDPLERQRGLVGTRVSGMDIFVDPIESEIQVLSSSSIAAVVIDSLGLRLRRQPAQAYRSVLMRDVWLANAASEGAYELVFDASGQNATFRMAAGEALGSGPVGGLVDAGIVRFTLQPPPDEDLVYPLEIVPASAVRGEISFASAPREKTNIIDVSFVHADPGVVPAALNQAGRALREKGADRVRQSARADIDFINDRLSTAETQLGESMNAIRDFKKTEEFTNLSDRERSLVNRSEAITGEIEEWASQRSVLADLVAGIARTGVSGVDLSPVLARLPEGSAPQVRSVIRDIREERVEVRRLLTEDRKSEQHPQVVAVRAEIEELGGQLSDAVGEDPVGPAGGVGQHQGEHLLHGCAGPAPFGKGAATAQREQAAAPFGHEVGDHLKLVVGEERSFHTPEHQGPVAVQLLPGSRETCLQLFRPVHLQP